MNEYITYEKLESLYGENNYVRRCINGKTAGCSKCVGYCMCQEHEGYLTNELRKEHDCINKQCSHYIAKPAKEKNNSYGNPFLKIMDEMKQMQDIIFKLACRLTYKYEGMRFTSSSVTALGKCELSYVTISNDYVFEKIIDEIERKTGYTISLKRLNCSFDKAVEIVMNKVAV